MVNCLSFFVLLMTIHASYFILTAHGEDELRRYRDGLSWAEERREIRQENRDSDAMRRELRSSSVNVNNEHLREVRGGRFDINDDKNRRGFEEESRRNIERENDLSARRMEESRKERLDRRERVQRVENDREVEGERTRSIESIESERRREEINRRIGEETRSERRMFEKEGSYQSDRSDQRIEDDQYVDRLGSKRQDRNEMRSDTMESVDRNRNVQDRRRENLRSEEERRRSVDRENESRDEGRRRFDRMTPRMDNGMTQLISDRVDNERSVVSETESTVNQSSQLTSILGQLVGLIVSIALINTPSKGYANKMKQLFTINRVTTTTVE